MAVVLSAGAVLALAFPAADVAPLAWIALAPLLVATCGASARRGAGLGFCFGLTFFGLLLYWISIVGYAAWVILVVLQASFIAIFGAGWAWLSRDAPSWARVPGAAALWVALEYARSVVPWGGFSWGELAQSQHDVPWMLRSAGVAGGWTIAFILVLCNASIAEAILRWGRGASRRVLAWPALAALTIAAPALLPPSRATGAPLRVALIQGNVPLSIPESLERQRAIVRSHARLTERLDAQVGLVVWPESSVGLDPRHDEVARRSMVAAARSAGAPMIVGGNVDVDARHYRVVAWLVDQHGRIEDTYTKTHLVPFGEYVPGRSLLDWIPMLDQIPRDAIAGDRPTTFAVAGGRVAPVLSYEGDFGSLVRRRIAAGGRLLIVATNTSTWGRSWASAQHVAMSQVRAAENGVWVVHAALSGISAFIAPDGAVASSTPLWTATSLTHTVRFATRPTLYARSGDWLPYASIAATLACCVVALVRRRRAAATRMDENA